MRQDGACWLGPDSAPALSPTRGPRNSQPLLGLATRLTRLPIGGPDRPVSHRPQRPPRALGASRGLAGEEAPPGDRQAVREVAPGVHVLLQPPGGLGASAGAKRQR